MDYVVGSIAALISGNVTPNRPKLMKRALTPTKHPSSPNVTPKSEYVEDRSIFLSPTLQKKKAVVKRSPKRIFETPDLDSTENTEGSSPKADKVKKHLKDELEAEEMGKSSKVAKQSPSSKQNKSVKSISLIKNSKINDSQSEIIIKENTPKKKKTKSLNKVTNDPISKSMDIDGTTAVASENDGKSPKKQKRKSMVNVDSQEDIPAKEESQTAVPNQTIGETANQKGKKKNKKHKKKNKQASQESKPVENAENASENTEAKGPKKKKRKNKNKKPKSNAQTAKEVETAQVKDDSDIDNDDDEETEDLSLATRKIDNSDDEEISEPTQDNDSDDDDDDDDQESDSEEEISNIANPNAITEQDTDSEHDSDDEVESENEELNNEVLKTDNAEDSSDEDDVPKAKKAKPQKETKEDKEESHDKEGNTEEEIKRTLFVGNVPFSNKCKKEIKKIFAQYGDIETVRIRTVPVKDARVTPKLAVIKNEIHPDRSTVNVYVKFADPDSVERALVENNTVLNQHHLRVSRSGATGLEHDPSLAVFLGNLPFGLEDEALRAKFEKCGDIHSVRIVRDKKTNAGKGFGYVNFASRDGVELALGLSEEDLTIKNRIIRVKRCTQTLNKAKKANKSVKPSPNIQGQNRNVGNQGQSGNNQGPNKNFGNHKNFGNKNQGPNRNFGNNQGPNRNFGNNQGQNRKFGNNQGHNRNFGNQGPNRNFGNQGPNRNFGNDGNEPTGASRRLMNKRPHQESGDGPPNKKQNVSQPPREKKQRKEFVGMTSEKKKKQKFDKGMKKKKAISEIMTKKT